LLLVDEHGDQGDSYNDGSGDQKYLFHVSLKLREYPIHSTQFHPAGFPRSKNSQTCEDESRSSARFRLGTGHQSCWSTGWHSRFAGRLRSLEMTRQDRRLSQEIADFVPEK
jgi:hypothetical protein